VGLLNSYFSLRSESDKNLLRPYSTRFNVSIYEKKIDFFLILDEKGFKLTAYDAFLSELLACICANVLSAAVLEIV